MDDTPRRLCGHGALLLLLGLVTGPFVMELENPRMGLAAHVEEVMNGTLLLALGPRGSRVALGDALYGTYANWAATPLAAAFGAAAMAPIAAGAHRGAPRQKALVKAGFWSVAVAMLLAAGLLVYEFRRPPAAGR